MGRSRLDDPLALPARVLWTAERHNLLLPGSAGVVAFSGGPDSLALLHCLSAIRSERGFFFVAVHVDHGLRSESQEEADRAEAIAKSLEITFYRSRLDTLRNSGSGNLQQKARRARYAILRDYRDRLGADWIALGHHADDQAETVLAHLLRGAGGRGLGAMAFASNDLVRPLLEVERNDIDHYIATVGLSPVYDPTNRDLKFQRTRIRTQILPLLRQENPHIVRALIRCADIARAESHALDAAAAHFLEFGSYTDDEARLPARRLLVQPRALLQRIFAMLYERVVGDRRELAKVHFDALGHLLYTRCCGKTRYWDLPKVRASMSAETLVFTRAANSGQRPSPVSNSRGFFERFQIENTGVFSLGSGRRLEISRGPYRDTGNVLSARRIAFPLTVRGREPGDRIAIGGGRTRKISRVLMDAKIPLGDRGSIPMVCQGDQIVLVPGVRRAAGWAPVLEEPAFHVRIYCDEYRSK